MPDDDPRPLAEILPEHAPVLVSAEWANAALVQRDELDDAIERALEILDAINYDSLSRVIDTLPEDAGQRLRAALNDVLSARQVLHSVDPVGFEDEGGESDG
jgi:hypothetical protein